MVKSKNKKSVIALVVMAFLLVASIVLAATGAWFTSSASGAASGTIKFGTVKVELEGISADTTLTKTHEADLTVDGCSWKIEGMKIKFTNTVDIYYAYEVKVAVSGTNVTESWFTVPKDVAVNAKKLTKDATSKEIALDNITVTFDSKNAANGVDATDGKITVTVNVIAVQADHVTGITEGTTTYEQLKTLVETANAAAAA